MKYLETSVGSNGKQNVLFPLEYMYITQGEDGGYSHQGSYSMDFVGYNESGVVLNAPYYAPCDLTLVYITGSSDALVWQSNDVVNFIDGTTDYICFEFGHDDNIPNYKVGDKKLQGQVIGHTGTRGNVTGDHVHMTIVKGKYAGYYKNSYDVWCLVNQYHLYNGVGVNDTNIINGYGYTWKKWDDSPLPPDPPDPPEPPDPPYPPITFKNFNHFPFYMYKKNNIKRR